ncbi:MAG: acyltransferase family protein [Prosthecobacter sp.]|uniref:acyltransferase family protein n=1 Tax=Prosthecobacter sp. TaxID=1965333 RepID=UPI0019E3AF59|nr:acyltransferase family protein [Prosthecobacter sp.]MBE2286406.1 acyltransferase family protein [Prosthecobacter sp.]
MSYRPDIDGLRALAVLSVLLFHAGLGVQGGYVGVDVFFVISGYLITGLILKDLEAGKFSLLHFWERRIRRIMPPLVVVVLVTLATGWWLLLAEDYKELGQSVVAQVLLLSNVFFWRESGYFEQNSDLKPLLHTWSLAVEEQFYVFFPMVLLVLMRAPRRVVWPVLAAVLLASFGLGVRWSHSRPEAAFYLLPTRAWELLLGALLAMAPDALSFCRRWLAELVGISGLAMILWAVITYDTQTRFPGVAALVPCMGAVLVIGCGTRSLAGRILTWPLLVGLGLVSYSLYLWHWPLLVFPKYWASMPLTVLQRMLLLAFSGLLGFLSWRFVEQPFRKRVVCGTRRSIYGFAVTCSASLMLLGLGVHRAQGIPSRIPAAAQGYADGRFDSLYRKEVSLDQARRGEFINLGGQQAGTSVSVLVWGDSHAMALLPVIDDLCREKGMRGVAAVHYQTPPLVNYECRGSYSLKENTPAFSSAVVDFIRDKKVPRVILTAAWNYHFEEGGGPRIQQALQETMVQLKAAGARVWVMEDVPNHTFDVPRGLASAVLFGGNVASLGLPLEAHRSASAVQHEVLQAVAPQNYTLLDPAVVFLNSEGLCRVASDGNALYTDNSHISAHGARLLRPLLAPVFE